MNITQNILLMLKDTPVLVANVDNATYEVVNERLLPYQLKNSIREIDFSDTKPDSIRQTAIDMAKNSETFIRYLSQRVLPLTKKNAKKIYNLFGFEQLQDDYSKSKIAIACRAVSLQDNYWLKNENDNTKWQDINLRTNKLNEIVAQVSLHGHSLTLTGEPTTPELTGQGAYAKAWKREDGDLYLYKRSTSGSKESEIEVMTSNILAKCNVDYLPYREAYSEGVFCSKCKCMTTDDVSILPAMDYESFCNRTGMTFINEVKKLDPDNFYKMCIVDYLISNSDRHGQNWGFFYNSNNMEIQGLHPLFDHNNAFDEDLMKNADVPYRALPTMTMKEAAHFAIKKIDFHFTEEIKKEDFLDNNQYSSFMKRAEELNICINRDSKEAVHQLYKYAKSKGIDPSDKHFADKVTKELTMDLAPKKRKNDIER